MESLLGSDDLGRLKQSMLLGLARHPLALPDRLAALVASPGRDPALTALALAGQRQRFVRPQGAGETLDAARHMHLDPRPILPDGARRALRRLANGVERGSAAAVLRAAVRRIARAGFRLHPFDLPRMVAHIRDDAENLGLAERAYLSLTDRSTKAPVPGALHAEISVQNWGEFPKGHRVAFLAGVRRQDPAAGRALIADAFKSEAADLRGALLESLAAGLGPDDLGFLDAAMADRAESVRAVASRLIARVPGTPAFAARLAEAAHCFARSGTGLTRLLKRAGLAQSTDVTFSPPKAAGRSEQAAALRALFAGLPADDVASAAGLTMPELLAALPVDDDTVFTALLESARLEGRGDLMVRLIEHKLSHAAAGSFPLVIELATLAGQLAEPLSMTFAEQLLGSAGWQAVVQRLSDPGTKDDGTLVWTAVMMPAVAMPRFLDTLNPLAASAARSARDLAEMVMNLKPQ
jgi:uncharacterized protein DUF5691